MELMEEIKYYIKDEDEANTTYTRMANNAADIGMDKTAQILRGMAADELRHKEMLEGLFYRPEIEFRLKQYYWTAIHKSSGEIAESGTPTKSVQNALRDAKRFVRSSWRFPGEVLIEAWDIPHKYSDNLPIESLGEEYLHIPDKYITLDKLERSGVIVTITDSGDTPFQVGSEVEAELFDLETDKMIALGKRPALGEYHY